MSNYVSLGNNSMSPNQERVFKIMNHLKKIIGVIDDAIVVDMKRVNNIGDFYNDVHKFIDELNNTNDIKEKLNGIFNKSNTTKLTTLDNEIIESFNSVNATINDEFYNDVHKFIDELNNTNDIKEKLNGIFNKSNTAKLTTLDQEIIKSFNSVNTTINDGFYNDVHKFINELNNTNDIKEKLNGIFNKSNTAKLTTLDQEIIKSFNSTNGKIIDGFYNDVHKFIDELNNTNDIKEKLNGIFNKSNTTKLTTLDNEIIKSFNSTNGKIIDEFYNDVHKFIDELNNTNDIKEKLNGIFNKSNTTKLTKLDQEIIDTFTNNIQKSTKWLQYYYDLEKELRRAMKPDPMIAYRLGNVPTFLPKIGIGDITNKIGEKYGSMIDGIKGINIPPLSNVMPSYVDYDALDIVLTESNDGEMVGEKKILDKGVTTQ